jgi:hypothetical protein
MRYVYVVRSLVQLTPRHCTYFFSLDLTEEGGIKAAGSSVDFAFPPELADALRRLYHLRRGPLLSPGPMRSNDDRLQNRSLFIRLPLEDCLCMMAPSLWSTGLQESPSFESVPPDTLALWGRVSVRCRS